MGAAREELQESRMRIESLGYQLNALQKQVRLQISVHIAHTLLDYHAKLLTEPLCF